ncbi:uncharacterized protein [Argopecten irradians]|uniref:uncharacterized protein n=1 Tax=Argopecten irradians TaxID=31199 RepID=UPI00372087CD
MAPTPSNSRPHPNKNRKVPLREKFAYGAGHVLNDMVTSFLLSFIAIYVTVGLRISVTFAGYILFVILVTDALSRPVIIVLSRKLFICCYVGRRKSWHILGSIVVSGCIIMIFGFRIVPEVDDWPRFLVYAPIFILLAFFFTCVQVSHKAILREMTGLTSEKNLLSAWRSISSLAANISVFVVAAIVLGTSGDSTTSDFTTEDAASFSFISYFILVTGGSCCIAFYLLVPEKTQSCDEARDQFNGCCYRSKAVLPYGSTKASNLRRGSNVTNLAVNSGNLSERRLSGSSGSGQPTPGKTTKISPALPAIKSEDSRAKSPNSLSKTGHLIINVKKLTDGNKIEAAIKGQRSDNVQEKAKGQGNSQMSKVSEKDEKPKIDNSSGRNNVQITISKDTEKSPKQARKTDLQTTVKLAVNTSRVKSNFKAKQFLNPGDIKSGSRSPSPGESGRKSSEVGTSQNVSLWCCICPRKIVKVTERSKSNGKASVKIKRKKSTGMTKNGTGNPEKSKLFCWCCRRQKDNQKSRGKDQKSDKNRMCCPWFKGMCRKPKFFKSVIIHACSKLAFLIAQVYMPLYLTESLDMHKISTALVPLVVYLAGFVATLVTRKINAKYGRKRTFAIGEGCVLGASVWLFFIPVESSGQVYATACLLGVGLSTLQVRSVSMMTDLTGSPVDSGAALFGVNEKVIQAVAILLVQLLSPCRLDAESDDCKLFYRSVMLSMPGGTTFISFLVLSLAKIVGIDEEQQSLEVSDGNAIEISSSITV